MQTIETRTQSVDQGPQLDRAELSFLARMADIEGRGLLKDDCPSEYGDDLMSPASLTALVADDELTLNPGRDFGYRFTLKKNGRVRRNADDEFPF